MPPTEATTRVGHGREHGLTLTVDGEATVSVVDDTNGVTLSLTPARRRGRRRAVTLPVSGALSVAAALREDSDGAGRRDVETVRCLRGRELTVRTTPRGSFEVCLSGRRRRGRRVAVVPDHETARSLAADLRQAAGDVVDDAPAAGGEVA